MYGTWLRITRREILICPWEFSQNQIHSKKKRMPVLLCRYWPQAQGTQGGACCCCCCCESCCCGGSCCWSICCCAAIAATVIGGPPFAPAGAPPPVGSKPTVPTGKAPPIEKPLPVAEAEEEGGGMPPLPGPMAEVGPKWRCGGACCCCGSCCCGSCCCCCF